MILLIDNYDSFSYNLFQLIGTINPDIKVIRNDELTVAEVESLAPDYIVLSPGPGKPKDAGICVEVVKQLGGKIPIFGVCLGHQAICEAYGGTVSYAKEIIHGQAFEIEVDNSSRLFNSLSGKIMAARYHSLALLGDSVPNELEIIAKTSDGEIMAVQHSENNVYGVQFHPESILTPNGIKIVRNFLEVK